VTQTSFWEAFCEDIDCFDCEFGLPLYVESPEDWDRSTIIKYLQVQGYSCVGGNAIDAVYLLNLSETDTPPEAIKANPSWR
jgi:hypothetical protein